MAYNRPTIHRRYSLPGGRSSLPMGASGVFDYATVASESSLGVVQIGNNINVDANGVISTYSSTDLIPVYLADGTYLASDTDYFIGAKKKGIEITLPIGVAGKVYIVKNQANGDVQVAGTNGQLLDTTLNKVVKANASITVVFDGTQWNII